MTTQKDLEGNDTKLIVVKTTKESTKIKADVFSIAISTKTQITMEKQIQSDQSLELRQYIASHMRVIDSTKLMVRQEGKQFANDLDKIYGYITETGFE